MANFQRRGALGAQHNQMRIDHGTLALTRSQTPGTIGGNSAGLKEKSRVLVRLPTLEIFAASTSALFATHQSSLTAEEKSAAKEIFGDSIDLEAVRIIVSPIVAAPTTLGNYIRVSSTAISKSTLIHELAHIWQF